MFERFTEEARRVVTRAVEEGQSRSAARVGTEHLLVGALDSGAMGHLQTHAASLRGVLDRLDEEALEAVGIDPGLIGVKTPGSHLRKRERHLPFTGAAKDTLKQALREAIALDHRHIGAEHIILALSRLPAHDRATRAMLGLGLDPADLRESVLHMLRRAS